MSAEEDTGQVTRARRREMATELLAGILACPEDQLNAQTVPTRVRLAYQYADELIAQDYAAIAEAQELARLQEFAAAVASGSDVASFYRADLLPATGLIDGVLALVAAELCRQLGIEEPAPQVIEGSLGAVVEARISAILAGATG